MSGAAPPVRLAPLDTLRGIAALAVLAWHYRTGFKAMPLADLLAPFYRSGGYAVPFFFFLSGYILSHVYLRESRRPRTLNNLYNRFARMGPLHYVTLVIVAVCQSYFIAREGAPFVYQFNDTWHFILNILFLQQSGLQSSYSFNGPSWSVGSEMIVNVLFLVAIARVRRVTGLFLAIALLALALLLWSGGDLLYSNELPVMDRLLLNAFASFFWGATLYQLAPPGRPAQRVQDIVFVAAAVASIVIMVVRPDHLQLHLDVVLSFVVFPALLLSAQRGPTAARLLSSPVARWFGYISFSLYLSHFLVQCGFHWYQTHFGLDYANPAVFATFVATALAVGYLVARGFEWPVYHLMTGRRLAGEKPAAPTGAAVKVDIK
jgi:peptidoglycan/LPS O-acetylase OafA/YrhL